MEYLSKPNYNPRTKILVINGVMEVLPPQYSWCYVLPAEDGEEPMCVMMEDEKEVNRIPRKTIEAGLKRVYAAARHPSGRDMTKTVDVYRNPDERPDILELDDVPRFLKDMGWGELTKEAEEEEEWDEDEGERIVMSWWEEQQAAKDKKCDKIMERLKKKRGEVEHSLSPLPAQDNVVTTTRPNLGGAGSSSNPSSSLQPTPMLTEQRNVANAENKGKASSSSQPATSSGSFNRPENQKPSKRGSKK